jgi:Uma2 family endonuclease
MVDTLKTKIPSRFRYLINGEWFEEDDMAESAYQDFLSDYLKSVIRLMLQLEKHFVVGDIMIYPKGRFKERIAPDVMVVKGISFTYKELLKIRSWEIDPPLRPAPAVTFEISSEGTWDNDVRPQFKPSAYAALGIQEYFAFDPAGVWVDFNTSLKGWRTVNGLPVEIQPNENGWLWSNELNCWVTSVSSELRLYSPDYQRFLSEAEDRLVQKEARMEAEREKLEAERQKEEAERERLEAERRAEQEREALERRAEQEREALERRIAELEAKLNSANLPKETDS